MRVRKGKGSTFHFTIQVNVSDSPPETLKPTLACKDKLREKEARDLHILLAEDNLINQRIAILMLRKLGYIADSVANGIEVIDALDKKTKIRSYTDGRSDARNGWPRSH